MSLKNCFALAIFLFFLCFSSVLSHDKKQRRKQQIDESIGFSKERADGVLATLYTIEAQ